jgi:hypothetical protein
MGAERWELENHVIFERAIAEVALSGDQTTATVMLLDGEEIAIDKPGLVEQFASYLERQGAFIQFSRVDPALSDVDERDLSRITDLGRFMRFSEALASEGERGAMELVAIPSERIAFIEYDADSAAVQFLDGRRVEQETAAGARSVKRWVESQEDYIRIVSEGRTFAVPASRIGYVSWYPDLAAGRIVLTDGKRFTLTGDAARAAWRLVNG